MSDDGLRVLDVYVGTWEVSTTSGESSAGGAYTAAWVLGGRFLQTTGSVKTSDGSNDFELISLMGHDVERGVYRTWSFMSNGMISESESTWDARARTMTKVTRYAPVTQATTSDFSEDGVEVWHMVNRDASGKVMSEMSGRNTRRSP